MRKDAQPSTGGIYRPRNPQASPLYQCVRRHSDDFDADIIASSMASVGRVTVSLRRSIIAVSLLPIRVIGHDNIRRAPGLLQTSDIEELT
jgi:hypothetical protein